MEAGGKPPGENDSLIRMRNRVPSSSGPSWRKDRCVWCNRPGVLKQVTVKITNRFGLDRIEQTLLVHPEHEQLVKEFSEFAVRNARRFLVILASLILAILPLEVVLLAANAQWALWGIALAVSGICMAVTLYPFPTPETVKLLGLRSAIRFARLAGLVFFLMSLALLGYLAWT